MRGRLILAGTLAALRLGSTCLAADAPSMVNIAALVGQPVDIAPSAYVYRADRSAERNPPESWLLLMQYGPSQSSRSRAGALRTALGGSATGAEGGADVV
jgi:hypothetical protein